MPNTVVDRANQRSVLDRRALAAWAAVTAIGVVLGGAFTAGHPEVSTDASPFHGKWQLMLGSRAVLATTCGLLFVVVGPKLADRLRWRQVVVTMSAAAFGWAVALAVTVGAGGLTDPLATRHEYLAGLRFVDGPGAFLRGFTEALRQYPVHVKGHPPGLVLVLWLVDRIGLGGAGWASILVLAVGASSVAAVLVTVREVADEASARRVAPFLVLTPAAVWLATSGDAFFTGLGAWAVCLTVVATGRRRRSLEITAGVLWAAALLSSYGLVLLAPVAVAVAWWRRRADVLIVTAAVAMVLLVALDAITGFWWLDGLLETRRTYLAGIASKRPASVFLWLNLCALALALGPAVGPGIARLRAVGPTLLAGGAVAGLALADLSLMSKGEVERIWLPWMPWVLVATVALPVASRRRWLLAQASTGLALQLALRSPW